MLLMRNSDAEIAFGNLLGGFTEIDDRSQDFASRNRSYSRPDQDAGNHYKGNRPKDIEPFHINNSRMYDQKAHQCH
ncbi:hypothetical protein D3C74_427830 [compost metagenome]